MLAAVALKILHIGKYFSPFSGGLENYMRDVMTALGRRGIECAALVHRHELSLKSVFETVIEDGHAFRVVRTGVWARLLFTPLSPAFGLQLNRLLRSCRPDILHLHLPNPSAFWVLALPAARRLPWVVHWHADVVTGAQGWCMRTAYRFYRPFEQALLKRADVVIVTSEPYLQASVPLRRWRDRCHVVPLGVDTGRLARAADAVPRYGGSKPAADGGPVPPLHVLAAGRQTYYKGFRYLIQAAALFADMRVDFVGDGDQTAELKALATALGLDGRVTFHGIVSDAELRQRMRDCDCLCLPSIERTEAFGLVLLEAMYHGKAAVVSDVPGSGMGWVVEHGVTGIKVPPADPEALAAAFAALAADRDNLSEMGDNARARFMREFEIDRGAGRLALLYGDILQRTATG